MDPLTGHSPPFVRSADSETRFYFSLKGGVLNYCFSSAMNASVKGSPDLPPASEGHTEPLHFPTRRSAAALSCGAFRRVWTAVVVLPSAGRRFRRRRRLWVTSPILRRQVSTRFSSLVKRNISLIAHAKRKVSVPARKLPAFPQITSSGVQKQHEGGKNFRVENGPAPRSAPPLLHL